MALPHTLLIPEGSRGGAKSAKNCLNGCVGGSGILYIKTGQNAVRFSRVVFCRLHANWEKDKMLSIFYLSIFHVQVYGLD